MSDMLTVPQWELLVELEQKGTLHVVDSYPPARKLVALGYATGDEFDMLSITGEGRDYLNAFVPDPAPRSMPYMQRGRTG